MSKQENFKGLDTEWLNFSNNIKGSVLKIAVVVSHPIQHFCPQYVSFATNKNIALKVFFGSALGYKKYTDENFKQEISWGNLQLDKFEHVFLNGEAVLVPNKKLDAPTLENELATFSPDVVIVYGYFQKLQRRAYAWANKNKVPLAYISDSELRHPANQLKRLVKAVLLRRYFSKISYFLTVGNANETFYSNHGVPEGKMLRMHFPIDLEQYENSYRERELLRATIRKEFGVGEKELVITVVGKLSSWKSQGHLIEALSVLEKNGLIFHLLILGSGETKDSLQAMAKQLKKSSVHFPGFVDIASLPAYYAATDIYAHPAALEPHSIAISEAIFMGCPIVLSDRCGSYGETDDVQVGRNGFVYEYGNIEALTAELEKLAANPKKMESFSNESHFMSAAFQETAHFGILKKLISEMAKRNG